jgi:inner membrane transporter RhtA
MGVSSATDSTAAPPERSLRLARAGRAVTGLAPASCFLASAFFHYLGPSFAVLLFAHLSLLGVAWPRIAAAAVFALWRHPWRLLRALTVPQGWVLLELGAVLAAMNLLICLASTGCHWRPSAPSSSSAPVVLAAAGARTRRNPLALATGGVIALTAVRLAGEPLGFIFAFANCAGVMLYVTLGHKIANISADSTRPAPGSMSGIGIGLVIARRSPAPQPGPARSSTRQCRLRPQPSAAVWL